MSEQTTEPGHLAPPWRCAFCPNDCARKSDCVEEMTGSPLPDATRASGHPENKVIDLMAALEQSVKEARAAGRQHLHAEFVEGCWRCDLSRDEVPDGE